MLLWGIIFFNLFHSLNGMPVLSKGTRLWGVPVLSGSMVLFPVPLRQWKLVMLWNFLFRAKRENALLERFWQFGKQWSDEVLQYV